MEEFISNIDLGNAYRKTKADLFYTNNGRELDILDFEKNLQKGLLFVKNIATGEEKYQLPKNTWTLIPKKMNTYDKDEDLVYISDPKQQWLSHMRQNQEISAEFRLIENLPIEIHVLSALWIIKVGEKFEAQLGEHVKGNRLRRRKNCALDLLSPGSAMPYLRPYCKWREEALSSIESALRENKSIIAITTDMRNFYHSIDAKFMLNESFIKRIGIKLTNKEKELNKRFIDIIIDWAQRSPIRVGLPVGLSASSLIANLSLYDLDKQVVSEITPIHYGRYVDDIILVVENSNNFENHKEVLDWIYRKTTPLLIKKNNEYKYECDYLQGSNLYFSDDKSKFYFLNKESGKAIVACIRRELNARTSEWRSLPDLPEASENLEAIMLSAIQKDGESTNNLKGVSRIAVRRAELSMQLRDVEAYSRALDSQAWIKVRHAFYDAFIRQVLVLPTFFELYVYISRVINLMVNNNDYEYLKKAFQAIDEALKQLFYCNLSICAISSSLDKEFTIEKFKEILRRKITVSILTSIDYAIGTNENLLPEEIFEALQWAGASKPNKMLVRTKIDLIESDLAYHPLKQYLLPKDIGVEFPMKIKEEEPSRHFKELRGFLNPEIIKGCQDLSEIIQNGEISNLQIGIIFPTRPFHLSELYILHNEPFTARGQQAILNILAAFRGVFTKREVRVRRNKDARTITIPRIDSPISEARIGVASWEVSDESWNKAVCGSTCDEYQRFVRFNRLINQTLSCEEKPRYLVFPEMAIPAKWFIAAAIKVQKQGISIISGVDYIHGNNNSVHNQVWAALNYSLDVPVTVIYRQDKQRPAQKEEERLERVAGKNLVPKLERWATPWIIDHGGYRFALLICSELTNIEYRAALRGKVDSLIIVEWNKDTTTFNSLVEATSMDIHTYIIQCNNRRFGDSRIRAPFKNDWERDIIRVKGGLEDYVVTGKIEIQRLRNFQNYHRSPDGPYKPLPDGYIVDDSRKTIPQDDTSN